MSKTKDVAVPAEQPENQFVQMVERFATNPDIDADKLQKLVDMQMQILDRDAKTDFYAAMNRVQAKLPAVVPNQHNSQTSSNYANLQAVSSAITPVYTAEGFSTSFWQGSSPVEGMIRVVGILRHSSGYSEPERFVDVPPDKTGIKGNVNKTDLHAAGSAFTYGRRYLKAMMFDISVGIDTDGNPTEYERISEEQVANIEALIDEVAADKDKFLNWANVEAIEDLAAKYYHTAIAMLEKKRRAG